MNVPLKFRRQSFRLRFDAKSNFLAQNKNQILSISKKFPEIRRRLAKLNFSKILRFSENFQKLSLHVSRTRCFPTSISECFSFRSFEKLQNFDLEESLTSKAEARRNVYRESREKRRRKFPKLLTTSFHELNCKKLLLRCLCREFWDFWQSWRFFWIFEWNFCFWWILFLKLNRRRRRQALW